MGLYTLFQRSTICPCDMNCVEFQVCRATPRQAGLQLPPKGRGHPIKTTPPERHPQPSTPRSGVLSSRPIAGGAIGSLLRGTVASTGSVATGQKSTLTARDELPLSVRSGIRGSPQIPYHQAGPPRDASKC
ncbi:hypothetical protein K440DRAFT_20976 [Wilcoxina mikolae CBS 423.85]|nr:hypothetical protein K440DRAFT_20976 [Wilcoxina mikolae CBS 423.85]